MKEARALQLLTLEHQFCIRCWMVGDRVRVISAAERLALGTAAYRAKRRRLADQHYRTVHPEVPR
jgi:hypothetical protein